MKWLALVFFSLIAPFVNLQAEIICTGKDCASFERKYGGLLDNFEKEYMPALARDMFRAQATSQLATIPYQVSLNKFVLGISGTLAYTETHKIDVYNPSENQYKKMNEFGFAINYNVYAGVNVGWVVSFWYSMYMNLFHCDFDFTKCDYTFELPLLSRIEVYANTAGNSKGINYNEFDTFYENRRQIANRGYALRYQVFQERRMFFDFLKFSGLSIGVGYQLTMIDFAKKMKDVNLGFQFEELKYEWSGVNVINYRADIRTRYAEIRTGFTILNFLSIYGGIGASISNGGIFFSLYRNGTYIVANKPTTIMIRMNKNYYDEAYPQKYYVAGVKISGFTIQGLSTFGKNTGKNRAITIGFSITF